MELSPTLKTRLRIVALQEGRSMKAIVAELIEGYLESKGRRTP